MPTLMSRIAGIIRGPRDTVKPTKEQGVPGFSVYGGYLQHNETNSKLVGQYRWQTASDILTNISVVAASVRFMMNLIARPAWSFEPADDSAAAKEAAEFMEEVIYDMDQSWTRMVRRLGMYRYHGFGMHEWVVKKRDDGKIGLSSLHVRPVHTIERWDLDEQGKVVGVWQRDPQTGQEIYLPRRKMLYLVDDTLSDRPDGMGWFRQLVDPAERLKSLLDLEAKGFERDLRGIPVGRAPITIMNQLVAEGKLTSAQLSEMVRGLQEFVTMQRKTSDTGIILDSMPYESKTDTGKTPSGLTQWGLELLTGEPGSLDELGKAVNRLATDMALIMGTDVILTGRDGEGSRALSEDKSRNLYLSANSILADIAEAVDRDIVDVIWAQNGFPEETKPKSRPEDVSFQDAAQMAQTLADMATAGHVLAPDDPAFDMLRDLMGMPEAKKIDEKMLMAMQGIQDPNAPQDQNDPNAQDDGGPSAWQMAKPGEPKPKDGEKAEKAMPRPLYVHRKLKNGADLIAWAKANGIETTLPADDMHVTVLFSRNSVDPLKMGQAWPEGDLTVEPGGPRVIERLGPDAVVLSFACNELSWRHDDMIMRGASHDYDGYTPHVTISYAVPTSFDLSAVKPYQGKLIFGPEVFEDLDLHWKDKIVEKDEGDV